MKRSLLVGLAFAMAITGTARAQAPSVTPQQSVAPERVRITPATQPRDGSWPLEEQPRSEPAPEAKQAPKPQPKAPAPRSAAPRQTTPAAPRPVTPTTSTVPAPAAARAHVAARAHEPAAKRRSAARRKSAADRRVVAGRRAAARGRAHSSDSRAVAGASRPEAAPAILRPTKRASTERVDARRVSAAVPATAQATDIMLPLLATLLVLALLGICLETRRLVAVRARNRGMTGDRRPA